MSAAATFLKRCLAATFVVALATGCVSRPASFGPDSSFRESRKPETKTVAVVFFEGEPAVRDGSASLVQVVTLSAPTKRAVEES